MGRASSLSFLFEKKGDGDWRERLGNKLFGFDPI